MGDLIGTSKADLENMMVINRVLFDISRAPDRKNKPRTPRLTDEDLPHGEKQLESPFKVMLICCLTSIKYSLINFFSYLYILYVISLHIMLI